MTGLSHDPDYFHDLYADDEDPWGFDRRFYERRKFDLTVAALPRETFRYGIEPGCANGALTERLAPRCERLDAFDFIPAVVQRARHRLARHPHVQVHEASFPTWWPDGTGDLVVWSEVVYYLTDEGLAVAERGLHRFLEPGGVVLAVHWTGETDYPRSGRAVARWLDGIEWLDRTTSLTDEHFEIGVWRRG